MAAKALIYFEAEYDNGNSGTSKTISWANGQKQRITITANTTLTISPPPGIGMWQLLLKMNGTGGYAVTISGVDSDGWLNTVVQPPFNLAANGITFLNFYQSATELSQSAARRGMA